MRRERPQSASERLREGLTHINERRQSAVKLANDARKVLQRSNALKEFLLYLLFLAVFCAVIFMPRNSEPFEVQQRMQSLMTRVPLNADTTRTFYDIATVEEMFAWLQGVFVPVMYPLYWYNGVAMTEQEQKFVDGVQRRVGTARLRQVRVRDDSCEVAGLFQEEIEGCYARYSEAHEYKETFNGSDAFTEMQWHWQSAAELETFNWEGETKTTYAGSGYVVDLPPNMYNASDAIFALNASRWVDLHTRAVFVDFSLYNANVDLFCVARLLFEFLPTGAVVTSATFRTLPLISTWRVIEQDGVGMQETVLLGAEGFLYLMVLRYLVIELLQWRQERRAYFQSVWNVLDMTNIFCFLVTLALRAVVLLRIQDMEQELAVADDTYVNLQPISFFARQVDNVNSFNAVLCFVKMFKYIRVNKKLAQFTDTLALASGEMLVLLVIIGIIACGYGIAFHMAFGHDVAEYRDFAESTFTLFQITLGQFDFSALRVSNRYLGPLLFMSYILIMLFVIVSMFLSIVDNAYEKVRVRMQFAEEDPLTRDIRAMRAVFRTRVINAKETVRRVVRRESKVHVDEEDPLAGFEDEFGPDDEASASAAGGSRPGSANWFGSRPGSAAASSVASRRSRPASGASGHVVGAERPDNSALLTRADIRRRKKQDEEMMRRVGMLEEQQQQLMKTLLQLANMIKEDEEDEAQNAADAAGAAGAAASASAPETDTDAD